MARRKRPTNLSYLIALGIVGALILYQVIVNLLT